jgi:hypothetical protein
MCSTKSGQLDRICRAIDELAARTGADTAAGPDAGAAARTGADTAAGPDAGSAGRTGADTAAGPDAGSAGRRGAGSAAEATGAASPDGTDVVARHTEPAAGADIARLAAIWQMVADADPELAKRLPGYLAAAE